MPLQKTLRGLPNTLGLYQGGNLKFDLDQFLKVQLSAEDYINPIEDAFLSGTLTAQFQIATHADVPQGEFWRVRSWHIRSVDNNNTTAYESVISDDGSRFFGLDNMTKGFSFVFAATQVAGAGIQFPGQEGLILRPGQKLGFLLRVSSGAGTSADFTTWLRYQVIKF